MLLGKAGYFYRVIIREIKQKGIDVIKTGYIKQMIKANNILKIQ